MPQGKVTIQKTTVALSHFEPEKTLCYGFTMGKILYQVGQMPSVKIVGKELNLN